MDHTPDASKQAEEFAALGDALAGKGRFEEAADAYRRAIALRPDLPVVVNSLGNVLLSLGRLEDAADTYRQILKFGFAEPYNNLGNALQRQGRHAEAIEAYRKAILLKPGYGEAHFNMANALSASGRPDEALVALREVIRLRPDLPEPHLLHGIIMFENRQFEESISALNRALQIWPDDAEALYHLAQALLKTHRTDEAIAAFRRCLAIQPGYGDARAFLGICLLETGRSEEAFECLRQASSSGADPKLASVELYALNFHPTLTHQERVERHARWYQTFAKPLQRLGAPNNKSPAEVDAHGRRLRIGYVSPDLGNHPVGRFMLPILKNHNHREFEIFCYSDIRRPDEVSDELRRHSDLWRDTRGLSDQALAELIVADRIDVLVDLAMHTTNNRLLTFARKPAPVQISYLAYAGTTGLETIDYRITDPYLDPPGEPNSPYVEKPIRLQSIWCYSPPPAAGEVAPCPAAATGSITFGCLNNFAKVSQPVLDTWIQLLREVRTSRLVLYCPEGSHRCSVQNQLECQGVDASRLEFVSRVPMAEYFRRFNRIDISLDTFPYSGGTTTCDSLWMGVPVVSLAGAEPISRGGLSILSNLGLSELVAFDVCDYVRIATLLANDHPRLEQLRNGMRQRMLDSVLTDGRRFTADLEFAYRHALKDRDERTGGVAMRAD